MIELRLWRSFVAVAEELNFRRAAERLNISQPALTKQIQDLEAKLGVTLFRRETHGVEPTDATTACLDAARALIDQAMSTEEAFKATQRSSETTIRLGMPEFFFRLFLPEVLAKMRSEMPEAKISMLELNAFEASGAVADGKIDLGISRAPVTEKNVVARRFRRGTWLLVMPATHPLASKAELGPVDLGNQPLIFFLRRLNPELFDIVTSAIESTGRSLDIAYQTQDPLIGVELTANGIGLSLVVSFAIDTLPDGLVARPVYGLGHEPKLDLVWRRDRMTPALRMLIDALLETRGE